ncbi:MAG: tRNA-dihydrouridine synthase family protein [Clostridia bacterium]|nr:tRNA-dihydrouridine synthase family protein [Clostridia bacterium]
MHFRGIHARLFSDSPADAYFAPFFSPTADTPMAERDRRGLSRENNIGQAVIPQIMANKPEAFLLGARALSEMGYTEVNLNLGCPSGTVVSKNRGAGFLSDPDGMDRFFDAVFSDPLFSGGDGMHLSVKTRLGMFDPREFYDILPIYNRYPITEVILHPRVRRELYRGDVHTDMLLYTASNSVHPVCVNGDLFTVNDVRCTLKAFSDNGIIAPASFMFGRGAVSNPQLIGQARAMLMGKEVPPLSRDRLYAFFLALYHDAKNRLSGERHVLFRLKELFAYWIVLFDEADSYRRRLRKAETAAEFLSCAEELFALCPFCEDPGFFGNAKMNG